MYHMRKLFITLSVLIAGSVFNTNCQSITRQVAFAYRSIYSPVNADSHFRQLHNTHHVDWDWDLWGHAMKKIAQGAPEEVYASVDGQMHREQFCFSSDRLYTLTTEYILDQFGAGSHEYSARICIMPQDNRVACTCPRCTKLGNTPGNATPAVTHMLRRLAKRFPLHRFYTSAYNTTLQVPTKPLPSNVGVWISASRFQLRVNMEQAKGYKEMCDMISQWQRVTSNIYVWEYARNFNDYLSPFPCLHVMQSRLRLYRQMGVKGIFINGSGYDYSAFDDVQTAVLAQLLDDPDTDVDKAVGEYFRNNYPVTAELLTDYYTTLERRTVETNHHLPIYDEGMTELVTSYLHAQEFVEWRAKLDRASKKTQGDERRRLNTLLTALSYTQLRMMDERCIPNDPNTRAEMVEILRGYKELKNLKNYAETDGSIGKYLEKYDK